MNDLFNETFDYISNINQNLDAETIEVLSNTVLTFSDLITNRRTDYKFDLEKFTNISGKTGLYVQYSLVRAKISFTIRDEFEDVNIDLSNLQNEENALLKSFFKFCNFYQS